jgi:opacity protein-like surface antigen
MRLKLVLTAILVTAGTPLLAQVAPATNGGGGLPITIGAGFSDFHTDWNGRLGGPAVWIDWTPSFLRGFGLEAEGRDLNYLRSGGDPRLRQDTIATGPIYTWRRFNRFHPYGKFLFGYGRIDFTSGNPDYTQDSRDIYAPGGGGEYRVFRHIWVRGDYQYQFWTDFFHHHSMNPQGFTVGVAYNFRNFYSR